MLDSLLDHVDENTLILTYAYSNFLFVLLVAVASRWTTRI
jgi:hypothetical protein